MLAPPEPTRRANRVLLFDVVAAILIPAFIFWLVHWLGKRMGYDIRGLSRTVAASSWLDVGWYTAIADKGYWLDPSAPYNPTVFFPLWPALIAAFRRLTGLSTTIDAAFWLQRLAATVCCFSFLRYARLRPTSPATGSIAGHAPRVSPHEFALFMFVQPAAIFLIVPYPECLFLCLLCWTLIIYRGIQAPPRECFARYALLFALALLLGTCRPNGLFLGLAAGLCCAGVAIRRDWRSVELAKAAVVAAASVAALAAVGAILYVSTGQVFAFLTERAAWNESVGLHQLMRVFEPPLGGLRTVETLYVVGCIGGCVLLWRAARRLESLYCLSCVLLPAFEGKAGDMARYVLAAMPALLALQEWLARRRFWYALAWTVSCTVAVQTAFSWFAHRWPG